jgi:hypothetical protein
MNNRLIVGDEVKFREWQFGKLIAVDGDSAEVLMSNGTKIIKNKNELVKNKMLPRYIDIIANRYRFRYKGETIDYYDTVEEAVIARDKYLEELK